MDSHHNASDLLRHCERAIAEQRFIKIADTWNSVCLLVAGSFLVKLPKHSEAAEKLLLEARFAERSVPILGKLAPRYIYCGPAHFSDHGVVGLRTFHWNTAAQKMPLGSSRRKSLLFATGKAIARLHISINPANRKGLADRNALQWYRNLHSALPKDEIPPDQFLDWEKALNTLTDYFASDQRLAIVHGDLKPDHILALSDGCPLLLDWSNVGLDHPAADCATLMAYGSDDDSNQFRKGYETITDFPDFAAVAAYATLLELEKISIE